MKKAKGAFQLERPFKKSQLKLLLLMTYTYIYELKAI
jgi:hypothetical protein